MTLPGGVSYFDPARENLSRELRDGSDAAEKSRDDWLRRWMLSLAIGNGAGAIGLTSGLVNLKDHRYDVALILGLWFFAVGTLAAGVNQFFHAMQLNRHRILLSLHADDVVAASAPVTDVAPKPEEIKSAYNSREAYRRTVVGLQVISAAMFTGGILAPLITVTMAIWPWRFAWSL